MSYKLLRIVSYDNYKKVATEYKKRITSPSTIVTDLEIYPYSTMKEHRVTEKKYPLFCVLLPEIYKNSEKIFKNSIQIKERLSKLPPIALEQMVLSQIIEEIKSTNDIEGVKSTRKEINDAIKSEKSKIRFSGIVNMYSDVYQKKIVKIKELSDYRKIYNQLVLEEIKEKDLPDGKLFRKEPVYITEGRNHIHQGNPNEETIEEDLKKLIEFMNSDSYTIIIKSIITHYFFEYVHPYYDGNGRVGRYLLSSYLGVKLDVLTGISISQSIHNNKKKYEDAFLEVSHPKNYGEVTTFVSDLIDLIIEGQINMIEKLETSLKKISHATKYLKTLDVTEEEFQILFIMIQNILFDTNDQPLKNTQLDEIVSDLSRYKIDNITKKLSNKGYIIKTKDNPIVYELSGKIIDIIE